MGDVVPSVSGNALHGFMLAVRDVYGAEVVEMGLARLDADDREQTVHAASLLWIPMDVLRRAVEAWADAAKISADEMTERCGRISTERALNTILRAFLRFTSDEALISRAPLLYARVRNVGKLAVQSIGHQSARVVLTEWPNGTDRQMLSLTVAFEAVLERTGRDHARCRYRRTSDEGVFALSWGDPSMPALRWDTRLLR